MEGMVASINPSFWQGKKVLITGHTGFKGTWLSLLLKSVGAKVIGYSLGYPSQPSLAKLVELENIVQSIQGDIRNYNSLKQVILKTKPEIIIHMAAQSLVRPAYVDPITTYSTNVMGTVNLFESIRQVEGVRVVVNVTSDKCYENQEWYWGYRENEPMGGYDPYSSSKGCAELVTSAFRNSFFNTPESVALASVRAGNVIGGGDWATDRLIPDIVRALSQEEVVIIRKPQAIRPWQHVLEPISGYLMLAEKLWESGPNYTEAWNFGPLDEDTKSVQWIVEYITQLWGEKAAWKLDKNNHPHEAHYLKLDCSKAHSRLSWFPKTNLVKALEWVVFWYRHFYEGQEAKALTLAQIEEFLSL